MYVNTQRRTKRTGMGDVNCGPNPCGVTDYLFPFFAPGECTAYLACALSGGAYTPTPDQTPSGITAFKDAAALFGGGGSGGLSVKDAQATCAAQSGMTWNPVTSTCDASWKQYIPWAVAGLAAFVLLPRLLPGR